MASDLETRVDEIAPDIYRLSTWIPGITEHGFTFNQFLLTGDEPFLFPHPVSGFLFPQVSAAIERMLLPTRLRWISFGHLGRRVWRGQSLPGRGPARRGDPRPAGHHAVADRHVRPAAGRRAGGRRTTSAGTVRVSSATPHVPHNWEAGLWFGKGHVDTCWPATFSPTPANVRPSPSQIVWHRHWRPKDSFMPPA